MRYAALASLSVAVVFLLLVPGVTGTDDFPLSSHPMYATARPAEASFISARGVGVSGEPITLSMRLIADTDDPLIAEVRMRRSVQSDGGVAACNDVAARLAGSAIADRAAALEIIEVRADVAIYAAGDRSEADIEVMVQCPLP